MWDKRRDGLNYGIGILETNFWIFSQHAGDYLGNPIRNTCRLERQDWVHCLLSGFQTRGATDQHLVESKPQSIDIAHAIWQTPCLPQLGCVAILLGRGSTLSISGPEVNWLRQIQGIKEQLRIRHRLSLEPDAGRSQVGDDKPLRVHMNNRLRYLPQETAGRLGIDGPVLLQHLFQTLTDRVVINQKAVASQIDALKTTPQVQIR